jgi:hypothetical protein
MSGSFIHLRRALFGTSCVIVFGFGATQAFGAPASASFYGCTANQRLLCQNYCEDVWGPYAASTCYGTPDRSTYECRCEFL